MGLFDIFFKKKIQDDFFGELEYNKVKENPLDNYYTGNTDFNGVPIQITINADENGPTNAQKGFFVAIRDNYDALKEEAIIPFIKRRGAREDWPTIVDFDTEFIPDEVYIPRLDKLPIDWCFVFHAVVIDKWIVVDFLDMVPQDAPVE